MGEHELFLLLHPGRRTGGGDFSTMNKRDHFVDSVDGRGFLPGNRNRWVEFDKSRKAPNGSPA